MSSTSAPPQLGDRRFHGVMVSTLDSESSDPSSNLGGTCNFFKYSILFSKGFMSCSEYKDKECNNRETPESCLKQKKLRFDLR